MRILMVVALGLSVMPVGAAGNTSNPQTPAPE